MLTPDELETRVDTWLSTQPNGEAIRSDWRWLLDQDALARGPHSPAAEGFLFALVRASRPGRCVSVMVFADGSVNVEDVSEGGGITWHGGNSLAEAFLVALEETPP